jgi:2-phosphosulfolactate phosphatase
MEMAASIECFFLPSLASDRALAGSVAVAIDVLRATTSMAFALAHGCTAITPLLHIEDALAFKRAHPDALIGGERKGVKIDGFDLGNSPAEYGTHVAGRVLAMTTTNGTVALHRCRPADTVLAAAFVNLSASVDFIAACGSRRLCIVCAGTDDEVAQEDVLCAGAIVQRLLTVWPKATLNDQARLAASAWDAVVREPSLATVLGCGTGGRNVIACGHAPDIEAAAFVDAVAVACVMDADGVLKAHTVGK